MMKSTWDGQSTRHRPSPSSNNSSSAQMDMDTGLGETPHFTTTTTTATPLQQQHHQSGNGGGEWYSSVVPAHFASGLWRSRNYTVVRLFCLMLACVLVLSLFLYVVFSGRNRYNIPESVIVYKKAGGAQGERFGMHASAHVVKNFFNALDAPLQARYKRGLELLVRLIQRPVFDSSSMDALVMQDEREEKDSSSVDAVMAFAVYLNQMSTTKAKVVSTECPENAPMNEHCKFERFSFLPRIVDHIFVHRMDLQVRYPQARNLQKCAFMRHLFMDNGWKVYERLFVISNHLLSRSEQHRSDTITLDNFQERYLENYCKWGVNVIGSIKGEFGIGETSRSTVKALLHPSDKHSKVPVSITDLGNMDNHRTADDLIERKFGVKVSDSNEYAISIVHAGFHEMLQQKKTMENNDDVVSKYKIGMWNWELERFPAAWIVDTYKHYDEIWAPSLFNLDVFSEVSTQPIVKMPYIVDMSDIEDQVQYDRTKFGIPENAYAYLLTFDFLSYPERKNPDGALRAFVEAFPPEYVEKLKREERKGLRKEWQRPYFIFKSINAHAYAERFEDTEKYASMKRIAEGRDDVLFIDEHLSRQDSFSLKKSTNCFVSLHRAEGFGFNLAEAMYLEKAVIGTAYSSTLDFMSPFNSYLVDMDITMIKNGYGVYQTGYHWAEPKIRHASKVIRHVFEHPEEAHEIGKRAAKTIRDMFSPKIVGERMKQRIEYIKTHILKL